VCVCGQAGVLNDGFPLRIFRSNEICKFVGIHGLRQVTVASRTFLHVGKRDSGDERFIQLCYDLNGQFGRAEKRKHRNRIVRHGLPTIAL
jgi:hypothetical protein